MAMTHKYAPVMCLNEVFLGWVLCKYSCAMSPTLASLKAALNSRIVGLGVQASQLKEIMDMVFPELKETSAEKAPEKFEITRQTLSMVVNEGQFVLLEVQASIPSKEPVEPEWFKDGHKIYNPDTVQDYYNGYHTAILFLKVSNLLVEGSYTYNINSKSSIALLSSKPISLGVSTSIDKYQNNLVSFYTAKPEVPEDTWPPVSSKTYICLALIEEGSIRHAGKYAFSTIRGDADDIYRDKTKLQYRVAFSNIESGERLLVEGRPGSGKTTLVHKISQDWATDVLAFECTRLLVLVHLRAFCSDPKIDLDDILTCYFRDSFVKQKIMTYAEKHGGLGFCFILDGLDEYSPEDFKSTYIYKLIKKERLPKAIVLVSSRPAAVAGFRSLASRRVEVLGFLKEQISDYVNHYPFSSQEGSKHEKLKTYLDEHPNVHHMCYLPIHAAMICFLFEHLETDLPQTETKIYEEFTKFTILRGLYRSEKNCEVFLTSLKDLVGPQREIFFAICRLAFEMCISSKQVMTQLEAQVILRSARDDCGSLGFITIDRIAMRFGFQKTYTFLHLTFQEFLGAYYLASLDVHKQLEFIAKFGNTKELQQVWKFYCGLSTEHCMFRALLGDTENGDFFKIQCAFESQQPHVCDIIVANKNILVLNHNGVLTPSNFIEIAFVLSSMSHDAPVLSLDGCLFDEDGASVLAKKVGGILTALCFYNCNLQQLELVNCLLKVLPLLQMLDICGSDLDVMAIRTLTSDLNHPNLQILKVGSRGNSLYSSPELPKMLTEIFKFNCKMFLNVYFSGINSSNFANELLPFYYQTEYPYAILSTAEISLNEVKALSMDFQNNHFFTKLTLTHCGIDSKAASLLALGLDHCKDLKILELGFNDIGDDGAADIAKSIGHSCINLRLLDLNYCNLSDSGALVVAEILEKPSITLFLGFNFNITKYNEIYLKHSNVEFHTVDISNSYLGDLGAERLATFILSASISSDILQLKFSKNDLTHFAMKSLCSVLVQCNNLLILDISCNSLGVEGAQILSGALRYCIKLQSLDISSNFLTSDGVEVFVGVLQHCPNLLQLKANSNNIGSSGVIALVTGLRSCTNLQELHLHSNYILCDGVKSLAHAFLHRYWINLYILDIRSNGIASDGIKALAEGLKKCTTLQELYISYNSIQNNDAKLLSRAIKSFSNFQVLDTSFNNLQSSGAQAFMEVLCHCSSFSKLNISHNNIGSEGAQYLAAALQHWSRISELNVSFNNLETKGVSLLADGLMHLQKNHNLSCLRKIDFSSNGSVKLSDSSCMSIVDVLKHCTSLCKLYISSILRSNSPVNFIEYFCETLQILDVSSIGLEFAEVDVLARGLGHCVQLQELYISDNKIGDIGANRLYSTLKHLKNLCVLDISKNSIETSSIFAIFKDRVLLQEINLSYNCVGSKGVQIIASAIQHSKAIHALVISGMNLGSDGVRLLARSLKHCTSLQRLIISSNGIEADGAEALASVLLKSSATLQAIDISDNPLEIQGIRHLTRIFKFCPRLYEVNFSMCRCENIFYDSLKECNNLSKLSVLGNYFLPTVFLTYIASFCNNITELHIADCGIGAYSNTDYLSEMPTFLHLLNISHNPIGDDGAVFLASALSRSTRLHSLFISNARIEAIGAIEISKALKLTPCLRILDISSNHIEVSELMALKESFSHLSRLTI